MTIQGINIDFDLYDTRNMKIYELGLEKLFNIVNNPDTKTKKNYEQAELYSEAIFNFIREIAGEENAKLILVNRNNFKDCIEVLSQIVSEGNKLKNDAETLVSKYSLLRLSDSQ